MWLESVRTRTQETGGSDDKKIRIKAEADLWFLVLWARFPDCPPVSDGPSDDGFQLTLSVSKFTYLINDSEL